MTRRACRGFLILLVMALGASGALAGQRTRSAHSWSGASALLWRTPTAKPASKPAPPPRFETDRPLAQFAGLARIFRDVAGRPGGDAAAAAFEFELVMAAVTGRVATAGHSLEEYRQAFAGGGTLRLPWDRATLARDENAYRLHGVGYSAREIADMLNGRITRRALDDAQKMLMLGTAREVVSDYLDGQYRRLAEARRRTRPGPRPVSPARPAVEALVGKYAALHGVDRSLALSVAATESGFNQLARSPVGAIGVMQLMPGTARELGVDPASLEQNVEGGVRYLAWLLRTFPSVEWALVAYNAGPGFAQRLARGEVALYGETREFVRRVMGSLEPPEPQAPGRRPRGLRSPRPGRPLKEAGLNEECRLENEECGTFLLHSALTGFPSTLLQPKA